MTGDRSGLNAGRFRTATAVAATILAFVVVWVAMTAPVEIRRLTAGTFAQIPLEGLLLVALVLVLPPRARRVTAVVVGVVLGLLTIIKIFDIGFFEVLDRPFDSVIDWRYLGSAVGVVDDSVGRTAAIGVVVAAGLLSLVILVLMPWSALHLTQTAAPTPAARGGRSRHSAPSGCCARRSAHKSPRACQSPRHASPTTPTAR